MNEFVCLARSTQITPPKKFKILDSGDNVKIHNTIMSSFPSLLDGGGYELLCTKQDTNHVLCVVPPPSEGIQ